VVILYNHHFPNKNIMNYLLKSEYINRWKHLSDKELIKLQDTLVSKINTVVDSPSIVKSITNTLEILEDYMAERKIF